MLVLFRGPMLATHLPLLLIFLLISVKTIQTTEEEYQSIYGYSLDSEESINRSLSRLSAGEAKFSEDAEEFAMSELADMTPDADSVYDVIIIGAGAAGAVIASRLSEINALQVLLIEAGGNENFTMDIPSKTPQLMLDKSLNYNYSTQSSDKYCTGMNNHECLIVSGKGMGGSGLLNTLIAARGHPKIYDRWAAMGNPGWSFDELLPYFKKLETINIPETQADGELHGTDGPVSISYNSFHTPLAETFMDAASELGYIQAEDYNGKSTIGFSYIQETIENGTRMDSNRVYLHPIKNRTNLHVTHMSVVSKILIDPTEKRAIGVTLMKDNSEINVYVKKEVILSAGAIASPQLLMLSGIGPAEHLESLEIDVVKDAPVGENLMDHVGYGGLNFLVDQPVGLRAADLTNISYPFLTDFLLDRYGPLTVPSGLEALALIDVDNPNDVDAVPNLFMIFVSSSSCAGPIYRYYVGISAETFERLCEGIKNNEDYTWAITPVVLHPKSRGWIRLKNTDINTHPDIVPNYFNHPDDIRVVVEGIKIAINISNTKAMQKFGSRLHKSELLGCEDFKQDSNEYWECAIRVITSTLFQYAGTCKMASEDEPTAVVNPRLQVIGIKGLRVADASIIPEMPSAGPYIPTIMIAEKCADLFKEDWGYDIDT